MAAPGWDPASFWGVHVWKMVQNLAKYGRASGLSGKGESFELDMYVLLSC